MSTLPIDSLHHKGFSRAEIEAACEGKTFLNFDDDAFNPDMANFLADHFPHPSRYEQA